VRAGRFVRLYLVAGEPLAGRGDDGPEIVELGSVPGFVVFDLPGVPVSAGGTRLAPDVSVAEVALLARVMTYKFAALGERVGGAKAGVRGDPADRASRVLRRRGIVALPDFVCNAGAVIGYRSAVGATPAEVPAAADARITGLILEALRHPAGPFAGACELAGTFLRSWRGEPPGPPFAPGG
jgi:Glu/Leu/Phe/Val dehydrogenase, dimerisation domain